MPNHNVTEWWNNRFQIALFDLNGLASNYLQIDWKSEDTDETTLVLCSVGTEQMLNK